MTKNNFKMRCVKNGNSTSYKENKIYYLKNGFVFDNDAKCIFMRFDDFEHFQRWSNAEWELIIENQISTKEELEDGDICVFRNGGKCVCLNGNILDNYCEYNIKSNLTSIVCKEYDIMEVYRNKELIYEREEKSAQQIEIENIQAEMKKLNKRLEVLKGEM